jgi:exodeoxyribonuclease V alpha subunit
MTTKKAAIEILTVTVQRVRSTSEFFSVYSATPESQLLPFTVKQFSGPVRFGQRWCIAGNEQDDPRWGMQFVAQFATLATPQTERQFADFLASGLIDGWDMWKYQDLLKTAPEGALARYLREPEWLRMQDWITPEMARSLADAMQRGSGMAPIYAQLAEWGCSARQCEALIKYYGFDAVDKLTKDPYADILEINGYGWNTAEAIAGALGFDVTDPRRITAGLEVAVHERTWQVGSTWLYEGQTIVAAAGLLSLPGAAVRKELDTAIDRGRLVRTEDLIYPEILYRAEQTIAAQIAQRVSRHQLWREENDAPMDVPVGLSREQYTAVLMALAEPICLLTGGPGTGKTTTLRTLISEAGRINLPVTCMAPTGKAAARMTQAAGMRATTIHSRLKIVPGHYNDPADLEPVTGLVIVDEVSMLDTSLFAQMLTRISLAAQIILVGDPDQLPSVGPGAVLRDLIAADVLPRVHLDHVYRNEAGIAVNAARMRDGMDLLSLDDCSILSVESPDFACSRILDTVGALRSNGTNPRDILVLCPTNDGPSGRLELNQRLQAMLSPSPAGTGIVQYAGTTNDPDGTIRKRSEELRIGDPVMVTHNSSELGVFNGQVGVVKDVFVPKSLDVEIDGETITFAGEDKRLLTLAYAITGHKSQGSEAPTVIAPVFKCRVLSREWLYTVITRAKKNCTLIGDVSAIQGCIKTQRMQERQTGLVAAINKAMR